MLCAAWRRRGDHVTLLDWKCLTSIKEEKNYFMNVKRGSNSTVVWFYTMLRICIPWWTDCVTTRFKCSVLSSAGGNIDSALSACVSQVWHMRRFGPPVSPIWARRSRPHWGPRPRVSCRVSTWVWAVAVAPWWEESLSTISVGSEGLDRTPFLNIRWFLNIHTAFPVLQVLQKRSGASAWPRSSSSSCSRLSSVWAERWKEKVWELTKLKTHI